MRLFSKKKSSLDRKLSDLEKEIERVSHSLKNAEKRVPRRKHGVSAPKLKSKKLEQVSDAPVLRNERSRQENNEPDTPITGEKFANYFTAGHFQNLRPLRQERRIVRNKAIVMILAVILVFLWVLYVMTVR